ncbi:MAG: hypothetical protein H0V44_16130 [Planctomycetes bacterium]|nr:hypothetical protein [Planctomycetota bacterium]
MIRLAPNLCATAAAVCMATLVGCGGSKDDKVHPSAPVSVSGVQQGALNAANAYRSDAQVPALTFQSALNKAAIDHAGYQAIRGGSLTHYESTDGAPGGPADTGNALYRGVGLTQRIRAANGGSDLFLSNVYYEGISSVPGVPSIRSLWNTVYHRLPLMRHEAQVFGFGDAELARATHPGSVPGVNGYATTEYAGDLDMPATITLSYWPKIGQTGVDTGFSTDSETPDPLSSGNTGQSPGTPDIDVCGPPIHVICPTTKSWDTIIASIRVQGSSTNLSVVILCGGANVPSGASRDNRLDIGEIFLLPTPGAPLSPTTVHVVQVVATTVNTAPTGPSNAETYTIGSSPAWTFTTK